MHNDKIRLSPLVRLRMTFDAEMNLDKVNAFGRETYEKYLEIHQISEDKLARMIRALFVIDALLFLLISGKSWSMPGFGVEISSIPAIHEILLFASALSFFILCGAFITVQCYSAIIDQFGNRIVNSNLMDPDFFNASHKHFDFFLKIFRAKLNIWGEDFYRHGRAFAVFAWLINVITVLTVLTLPAAHLLLSWAGATHVFASDLNIYGKSFLLGAVGLINLSGLVMVAGMLKDFTFHMTEPIEDAGSEDDATAGAPSKSND